MNTPSILRLIIASLACVFVLSLVGCDDGARLRGMNNEEADNTSTPGDEEEGDEVEPEPDPQPIDEEGHGASEEEQATIEPGFMNGSWRAATPEEDTPAAYFDTFQDEGDTEVTGTYLMALAIYERLDGESGELRESSFDGDQLILKWNPTNDTEEVLTLQASRVDENTLEGRVTAKRNVEMDIPVKLTRTTVEE